MSTPHAHVSESSDPAGAISEPGHAASRAAQPCAAHVLHNMAECCSTASARAAAISRRCVRGRATACARSSVVQVQDALDPVLDICMFPVTVKATVSDAGGRRQVTHDDNITYSTGTASHTCCTCAVSPCPEPDSSVEDWKSFFALPGVRPHVSKVLHQEEWRESLRQSHPASGGLDAALSGLDRDVTRIERKWPHLKHGLQKCQGKLE